MIHIYIYIQRERYYEVVRALKRTAVPFQPYSDLM